jgi:hypothetical protein
MKIKFLYKIGGFLLILILILSLNLVNAVGVKKARNIASKEEKITKQLLHSEHRRAGVHDENLINAKYGNFGNLGIRAEENPGEWPKGSGVNYLFESTFYVGAEVIDANDSIIHIFSESSLWRRYREHGAPPPSHTFTWEPLPGYFNEELSNYMEFPAMSHRPETWPTSWPNRPDDWNGKWNGEFGTFPIADLESYYVMDDRNNDEFAYYPFIGSHQDSLPWPYGRRGLGVEVEVRAYQWSHSRLEDTWFVIFDISNVSHKDLKKVVCGFYHDWNVGAEGNKTDAYDDDSFFNTESNLVYQWDLNGYSYYYGQRAGYVAQKLLQTPDDLGLTSFWGTNSGDVVLDDEIAWHVKTKPGTFTCPTGYLDAAFITGTGHFALNKGETKRYATAIVLGEHFKDVCLNAKMAQWFYDGEYQFDVHSVELLTPNRFEAVKENSVYINWQASNSDEPLKFDIYYSTDFWKTWNVIAENITKTEYLWCTSDVADGIFYSVKIIAHNHSGMGESMPSNYFTINNSAPASPGVFITSPTPEEVVSGSYHITWQAGDADGDAVTLDLYYSLDNGETWRLFAENETNDGNFLWDTTALPNGINYILKAVVCDGVFEGSSIMDVPFEINNYHPAIRPIKVKHISGAGSGKVCIKVVDKELLTGHTYELTFSCDSLSKTYHVFDKDEEIFSLKNVEVESFFEGPEFDGIRLWIEDFPEAFPVDSLTGWTTGDANLILNVEKLSDPNFLAIPADFEIRILGSNADTAYSPIDRYAVATNFQVWNVTDSVKVEFVFNEYGIPDGEISESDRIILITNRESRRFNSSWMINFYQPHLMDAILPDSGDVLFIAIAKPFSDNDIFHFQPLSSYVNIDEPLTMSLPQDFQLGQNYPNPFNANTTIEYKLSRKSKVVIHVYDLLGREIVKLIDKVQDEGIHCVFWEGQDRLNQAVASGIYFYRIRAGEFTKSMKMIMIK